jgi:hypothetical protein
MPQNIEIAKNLINAGTKQIVGVLGGGDSYEIVDSFIREGGEFLESPSEFSSPIIASTMNKLNHNQNRAVSISIRGPGLVSSLPGLYHNFIEDLRSLSISEGLSNDNSNYSFHKAFDAEKALSSTGFLRNDQDSISKVFDLISNTRVNDQNRMVHFITNNNQFYSYNRSIDEMCSDQSESIEIKHRKKLFVIGKRGMEYLDAYNLLAFNFSYFLTPAALPFADLNSPNFLGVWTGNEQFKPYFLESNVLSESIIVRVGVMKRELLTLRTKLPHSDISLSSEAEHTMLLRFLEEFKPTEVEQEKNYLCSVRKKIANTSNSWSVYSVISIINEMHTDFNYSFDVGSYATIIENYIRPVKTQRLHSAFVGKFMGTAVPISIGVSLAEPSIPVLCMLGEGSIASSLNEVFSIANLQLPVCIIVFTDGSMNSIVGSKIISEQNKDKYLPSNYLTIEKAKIPNLPTYFANSIKQFTSALSKWDMKSPMIIFLKFDPNEYAKGVESLR